MRVQDMSRRITAEFPFVERFDEVAAGLPGAGLHWLDALRRDSLDAFNRVALPSTRVEAWKYTNLKDFAKTPFDIAVSGEGDPSVDLDGAGAGDRTRSIGWCSSTAGSTPADPVRGRHTEALRC